MDLPVDEVDVALFATATRVTVNNGRTATFWWSSWLDGKTPTLLFPLLFQHSKRKNRKVAEALQNEQWIHDVAYNLTVPLWMNSFACGSRLKQSILIATTQTKMP